MYFRGNVADSGECQNLSKKISSCGRPQKAFREAEVQKTHESSKSKNAWSATESRTGKEYVLSKPIGAKNGRFREKSSP